MTAHVLALIIILMLVIRTVIHPIRKQRQTVRESISVSQPHIPPFTNVKREATGSHRIVGRKLTNQRVPEKVYDQIKPKFDDAQDDSLEENWGNPRWRS